MADRLTQDVIADGMARAEKVACRPGDDRCYPFPDRLEVAQASCSAQRAPEGSLSYWGTRRVIVANSERDSWDVWLDVHTGEGRLRRRQQ
jgi:hypothetical protein